MINSNFDPYRDNHITIRLGRLAVRVGPDPDGEEVFELSDFEDMYFSVLGGKYLERARSTVDMSSGSNSQIYDVPLPTITENNLSVLGGVVAVLGGTESGKSTLINSGMRPMMAEELLHVTYMEDPVVEDTEIAQTPHELLAYIGALALSNRRDGGRRIIAVDSVREFLYLSGEGTGEGGLNMNFPVQLTALSNVLEVCGVLMVTTINPLIDSDTKAEQFKRLSKMFEASTSATLTLTKDAGARMLTWAARGKLNADRPSGQAYVMDLTDEVDQAAATSRDRQHSQGLELNLDEEDNDRITESYHDSLAIAARKVGDEE